MDPGDGVRGRGLHAAGAPGELQILVPGGGCFPDAGFVLQAEHHLPAEDGQRCQRDAGDGEQDPQKRDRQGYRQGDLQDRAEHHLRIHDPPVDEPVDEPDGGAAAAGAGDQEQHYRKARVVRDHGRHLQQGRPGEPGGAGEDEAPVRRAAEHPEQGRADHQPGDAVAQGRRVLEDAEHPPVRLLYDGADHEGAAGAATAVDGAEPVCRELRAEAYREQRGDLRDGTEVHGGREEDPPRGGACGRGLRGERLHGVHLREAGLEQQRDVPVRETVALRGGQGDGPDHRGEQPAEVPADPVRGRGGQGVPGEGVPAAGSLRAVVPRGIQQVSEDRQVPEEMVAEHRVPGRDGPGIYRSDPGLYGERGA